MATKLEPDEFSKAVEKAYWRSPEGKRTNRRFLIAFLRASPFSREVRRLALEEKKTKGEWD